MKCANVYGVFLCLFSNISLGFKKNNGLYQETLGRKKGRTNTLEKIKRIYESWRTARAREREKFKTICCISLFSPNVCFQSFLSMEMREREKRNTNQKYILKCIISSKMHQQTVFSPMAWANIEKRKKISCRN